MSGLAFWLVALASAGLGFVGVYRLGWRLSLSMLAGTAIALILSLPLMLLAPADQRSPYLQVELTLNGSIGLIFAGIGAGIAFALVQRRGRRDEGPHER